MPPVTDSSAGSTGHSATDYDDFAEAYWAENERNLFNAYYERPAMLALAGDVGRAAGPGRGLRLGAAVRGAARPGRRRERVR